MEPSRVLIVGENNPYGADPAWALHCDPPRCAGDRLRRILGLSEDKYLALHRKNLCTGDWSQHEANDRVWDLLTPKAPWNVVVLLGRKVAATFERAVLDGSPLVPFATRPCCPGMTLVSLPHPSGRNAAQWNLNARKRTREILIGLVPEVPWGSADAEEARA